METYRVSARSSANGIGLWNPSANVLVCLTELHITVAAANANAFVLRRKTARGTATTTVTPDINNAASSSAAPVSGVVLDTAFSVQPTFDASEIDLWSTDAVVGNAKVWRYDPPLVVPGGQGIGFPTLLGASDFTFVWRE